MSEWQDINIAPKDRTHLGGLTETYAPIKIDLYSAKRHIRWIDCGWSVIDGNWWSRHVWVDDQGRRTTTFRIVDDPTHWMPGPEFPEPKNVAPISPETQAQSTTSPPLINQV